MNIYTKFKSIIFDIFLDVTKVEIRLWGFPVERQRCVNTVWICVGSKIPLLVVGPNSTLELNLDHHRPHHLTEENITALYTFLRLSKLGSRPNRPGKKCAE